MARWVRAAAEGDCAPGSLHGIVVDGAKVVLANVDGDVYALEDVCSHQDYPLSDGHLDGKDVVCIYHGARFDACTGARKTLPAVRPVKSYPTEVRNGEIFVDLG